MTLCERVRDVLSDPTSASLEHALTLQIESGFVHLLRRNHRNERSIITALASALPMDGHVVFLHHEQGDAQIPAMAFFASESAGRQVSDAG